MKFGTQILKEISNWSIRKKKRILIEVILDILANLQQGIIIKDLSVNLSSKWLTCECCYKLVA